MLLGGDPIDANRALQLGLHHAGRYKDAVRLTSDAASYLTGTTIHVNGGMVMI